MTREVGVTALTQRQTAKAVIAARTSAPAISATVLRRLTSAASERSE
jgi:hypothetical protein